eukprot:810774_1
MSTEGQSKCCIEVSFNCPHSYTQLNNVNRGLKCSRVYHILVVTLLLYCTIAVSYLLFQSTSTTCSCSSNVASERSSTNSLTYPPTIAPTEINNIQSKCDCYNSTSGSITTPTI